MGWSVFDLRRRIECQSHGIKFNANTELGNPRRSTFICISGADSREIQRVPGRVSPWEKIRALMRFILGVFRAIALE